MKRLIVIILVLQSAISLGSISAPGWGANDHAIYCSASVCGYMLCETATLCSFSCDNGVWKRNYAGNSVYCGTEGEYFGSWITGFMSGCAREFDYVSGYSGTAYANEAKAIYSLINDHNLEGILNSCFSGQDCVVLPPGEVQKFLIDLTKAVADREGIPISSDSPTLNNTLAAKGVDPVYLSNGEYDYSSTDIALSGRGLPIMVSRSYGSRREYNGRFGFGWDMNYNMKVRPLDGGDEVLLLDGGGNRRTYVRDISDPDKYTRSSDRSGFILSNGGEAAYPFELVKKSGVRFKFDQNSNLALIVDRNGNAITLTYDVQPSEIYGYSAFFQSEDNGGPSGRYGFIGMEYKLRTVSNDLGRQLEFEYDDDTENGSGLLTKVVEKLDGVATGRDWIYEYEYGHNNLRYVKGPQEIDPETETSFRPTTEYAYEDDSNPGYASALRKIYDPVNSEKSGEDKKAYLTNYYYNPLTVENYIYPKVESQLYGENEEGEGSLFEVAYDTDSRRALEYSRQRDSSNVSKSVTVTTFNAAGQTANKTIVANPQIGDPNDRVYHAYVTSYEYNSYGEVTFAILPKRNCVETQYDARGNAEEITLRSECDVLPFNGTSDYITIVDANDIYGFDPNDEDFSIVFWVKRLRASQEEILFDKRDASGDGWCVKFDAADKIVCLLDDISISSTTEVADNDWHYVVVSIDGAGSSEGSIYVDGGLAEGTAATNSESMDTTASLTMGRCSYASSGYFQGSLDDVMVLNRSVSRETADHYSIFGLSDYTQGLVGYWKMDDNTSDTIVIDSSESGKNGTAYRDTEEMVADGKVSGEITTVMTFKQHNDLDYVATVTDPVNNVVTYTYDFDDPNVYGSSVGNLMKVTYPAVSTPAGMQTPEVAYTYNSYGQIATTTSAEGIVTKFDYYTDPNDAENYGRLWKTTVDVGTDPACLNIVSTVEYDSYGHAAMVTDDHNNTTELTYNALDLLVKTKLPAPFSYETEFIYNKNEKLARTQQTIGDTTQYTDYTYNLLDKLTSVMDPLEHVTSMGYDDNENITSVTDAEENVTHSEYDERDMLWKTTDAEGGVTEYTYDANGNLVAITDAEGNVTTYTYDHFDRLMYTTYPDDTYKAYTYNILSQMTSSTNRNGDTVTNTYDNVGRLVSMVGPDNDPNIAYTYDIAGRVVEVDDSGAVTGFSYDRLGRAIQVEDAESRLVDYSYDNLSRRTALVYPDNSYITYEYDELSRLTMIIDDSNDVVAEYTYDELSRRTLVTLQNDANAVYTYDLANRLTALDNSLPDPNNAVVTFDYSYDNVGNRLSMTVDGNDLHSYDYDDIYQLTDVDYPAGAGADTAYAYDKVHNRTSTDDGDVVSYTANDLNQYTAVGAASLAYDNNGNLTDDGAFDYEYDIFNRLIRVEENSITIAEYGYDYAGKRIVKNVGGAVTKYAYDGDQVIAEYDGSDTLLRKFIYGPGIDEAIYMITVDGQTETRYYYHYDGLGSVVALSNMNGDIVEAYAYDVFGEPTIYTAAGADGLWRTSDDTTATASAIGNPYLFTGRRYDNESGLYYYRARMYAPELGRFMQTDPIGYTDGMNWYAYCGNNSSSFVDPMGLCKGGGFWERLNALNDWINPMQKYNQLAMQAIGWATDKITDRGRYVGAGYGDEALDYYINEIVFGDAAWYHYLGAGFSALWTPENYKTTAITLGSAYVGAKSGAGAKSTNKLLENATTPGKAGVSPVGRALQKHASRQGSFFQGATGNAAKNTQIGTQYLDDILQNGTVTKTTHKVFGDVTKVRLPNGAGAWWKADGSFIGFLELY